MVGVLVAQAAGPTAMAVLIIPMHTHTHTANNAAGEADDASGRAGGHAGSDGYVADGDDLVKSGLPRLPEHRWSGIWVLFQSSPPATWPLKTFPGHHARPHTHLFAPGGQGLLIALFMHTHKRMHGDWMHLLMLVACGEFAGKVAGGWCQLLWGNDVNGL